MPEHADDPVRSGDFVLVAELDPALAAAAVSMLRREGVPAYVGSPPPQRAEVGDLAGGSFVPHEGGPGALYVPRPAAATARRLLDEHLPHMRHQLDARLPDEAPDAVDEAVWAELVAAFEGPSADVSARRLPPFVRPDEERDSGPATATPEELEDLDQVHDLDAVHRAGDAPEDLVLDEHFEPDPPPPLPRLSWLLGSAWAAVLGTPILFLIALWVHVDVTGWLGAIGVSCFVGGFLVLVSRLGDGPDEWDDGAVV